MVMWVRSKVRFGIINGIILVSRICSVVSGRTGVISCRVISVIVVIVVIVLIVVIVVISVCVGGMIIILKIIFMLLWFRRVIR